MEELLSMNGIVKSFPGVQALKGVHFDLRAGEVHALIGENGAGKSTLMKILTGSYQADEGEIIYQGKPVSIPNPRTAQELGINIVHQEIHLMPDLSVAENIFVGIEPRSRFFPGMYDFKEMNRRAGLVLAEVGLNVAPETKTAKLSVAQQQMVAIARILELKSKIVVLDEPTAALAAAEVSALFAMIGQLKEKGIGIVYISHRMEELDVVADRVSVFRDGSYIKTLNYRESTRGELISLMVGRELVNQYPSHQAKKGEELLWVKELKTSQGLMISDFHLYRGEILGLYGLVGAGRTEFARALFGADRTEIYQVMFDGKDLKVQNTVEAVRYGIGYLTEDRKRDGLALGLSVENNISMASLSHLSSWGVLREKECKTNAQSYIEDLKIRTPSFRQLTRLLSGGNQQKVIIARWLTRKAKLLIFDEPTRGIDVGARKEIYDLLNRLVESGVGVMVISSDLPEVMGVSDRIVVMHDLHVTGDVMKSQATQERLLEMAVM